MECSNWEEWKISIKLKLQAQKDEKTLILSQQNKRKILYCVVEVLFNIVSMPGKLNNTYISQDLTILITITGN